MIFVIGTIKYSFLSFPLSSKYERSHAWISTIFLSQIRSSQSRSVAIWSKSPRDVSHQPQRNRLRNILATAIACNLSEKSRRRWVCFEAEQIDFPCFLRFGICRARISRWSNKIVSALTVERMQGLIFIGYLGFSVYTMQERESVAHCDYCILSSVGE